MVFGILQLINFAHGDVYMVGAFSGYYAIHYLDLSKNPSWISLGVTLATSMVASGVLGGLIERFAYRPLRRSPRINVLITAVGVSLFLEFSGQLIFGADPKFFPQVLTFKGDWSVGELKMNPLQFLIFFVSILLMLALDWMIFRTRFGRAMRATSFNSECASLMGIPTQQIISTTFILGSALAGAAGVLVGLTYPKIDPLMGTMPGLKAFVAAVLGGVGNIRGAVLGAMILGLSEEFLVGYGAPSFRDALAFGLLIIILLFKPTGLLGLKRAEKV